MLQRVNLMLTTGNAHWLDRVASQIRERTGAKVSRSEIAHTRIALMLRAMVCGKRLVNRLAPQSPSIVWP
jgi:hypothetical protein